VQTQNSALQAMNRPYASPPKWYEYSPPLLSQARTNAGVVYWNANRGALERAEREYGVPPEIVVAIIGVETFYGRISGNYRVLDALTTLAFDYPRRADFFREELRQFLLLHARAEDPAADAEGIVRRRDGHAAVHADQLSGVRGRLRCRRQDRPVERQRRRDRQRRQFPAAHGWERGGPVLFAADVDAATRRRWSATTA
jgi:membrane-bound lytic murein transglycosylase B